MPDTLIPSDFLSGIFGFNRNSTFGHISDRFRKITFQLRNFFLYKREHTNCFMIIVETAETFSSKYSVLLIEKKVKENVVHKKCSHCNQSPAA